MHRRRLQRVLNLQPTGAGSQVSKNNTKAAAIDANPLASLGRSVTRIYTDLPLVRVFRVGSESNGEQKSSQGVVLIQLFRPKALNALSDRLMASVGQAVRRANADFSVNCIVLTGAGKAFAAGADIKEMKDKSFYQAHTFDKIAPWEALSRSTLPVVCAVNGYALGGGCEVAMMCDVVYASDKAKFGQPEIKIGTIPGAAGTQRLTRVVGKSEAMRLVLTGRFVDASAMAQRGLCTVVPHTELLKHAMQTADDIASMSRPVVCMAKEAVNSAYETTLQQGIRFERRLFHSTFGLKDRKEGMAAFAEGRNPRWMHE